MTNANQQEFCIFDATIDLAPQLVELERQVQSHPWSLATFLLELARSNRIFLAAKSAQADFNGAILGYACGWLVAGESQLHNLAVAAHARGRGLGTALAQCFLQRSKEAGAHTAVLEVRMANLPAIALYRRLGFSIVGWRPGYYDAPRDDACMMILGLMP